MAGKSFEVGGARFDAEIELGGSTLVLNGYGLRRILLFNAYAIGLYLATRQKTNEAIFAEPGPKRLRLVMLRDLSADQLADVLEKGIGKNISASELEALKPRLKILHQAIESTGSSPAGAAIEIDWLPGKGKKSGASQMNLNGEPVGKEIPGEDFFVAVLKVWLGDQVNDTKLRDALRGK